MRTGELNSCVFFDRGDGFFSVYIKSTQRSYKISSDDFEMMLGETTRETESAHDRVRLQLRAKAVEIGMLPNQKPTTLPKGLRVYNCDRFFDNGSLLHLTRTFISFAGMPVFLAAAIWSNIALVNSESSATYPPLLAFVFLAISAVLSVIAHEVAHAVIARCNGAHIPEMGVQLAFGKPLCYTKAIGLVEGTRKQRMEYYAAGINMHCLLAGASLFAMDFVASNGFLASLALTNGIFMASNAIALVPITDGFNIASILAADQNGIPTTKHKTIATTAILSVATVLLFALFLTGWLAIAL